MEMAGGPTTGWWSVVLPEGITAVLRSFEGWFNIMLHEIMRLLILVGNVPAMKSLLTAVNQ